MGTTYPDPPAVLGSVWDATQHGLAGDGSTDDSAALQALIGVVAAAGGGTIFFPSGVYRLDGAFTSNGVSAPIVSTPAVDFTVPTRVVTLLGPLAPPNQYFTQIPPPGAGNGYAILKCTRTDGGSTACVIGGPAADAGPGLGNQNNVVVNLEKLVLAAPANPTFTFVDLKYHQSGYTRDVLIFAATTKLDQLTQPTHANAYGITFPEINHSARHEIANVNVFGFYTGARMGELTSGSFRSWGNFVGIEVPPAYHPSVLTDLGTYWGPYHVKATGTVGSIGSRLMVFAWDIENANGAGGSWQDSVAHVYDPTNRIGGGVAGCFPVSSSVGYVGSIVKNGGTNFPVTIIGAT